jgi:hypothetical protein
MDEEVLLYTFNPSNNENCFVIRFSLKINMESLDPLYLDNIAYKRSGRFFDNQPLEVTIIL